MYVILFSRADESLPVTLTSRLFQRPTARELLKHKFVRMAKKTSYLTELIDRHERWKAEGGDKVEEEELHPDIADLYVNFLSYSFIHSFIYFKKK